VRFQRLILAMISCIGCIPHSFIRLQISSWSRNTKRYVGDITSVDVCLWANVSINLRSTQRWKQSGTGPAAVVLGK